MTTLKFDAEGRPICKHCGGPLNEEDDLDMDSGYCSETCHLAATEEEDDEMFGEDDTPLL